MRTILCLALALPVQDVERRFTDRFQVDEKTLGPTGRNPYFILEPGWRILLENPAKKEVVRITVLEETRKIGGVETRVIEEHETKDSQVIEISRNYFAICARTNAVYYFGEDVDEYKDGKVVGHPGAWLHGEKGARFGLIMPGQPLLGARYCQEVAPGVAMDRAEITGVGEAVEAPGGTFENVIRTEETTPLEPGEKSVKRYAPGIGLIEDGGCRLVKAGPK